MKVYEVTTRTSSVEALELFRVQASRFDLVITDMTMPNMTGDRLAQELLGIRPDIPIILCTGFSEHITEEKAKAIGIRELVVKPLSMKELAKAMRRGLDFRQKEVPFAGPLTCYHPGHDIIRQHDNYSAHPYQNPPLVSSHLPDDSGYLRRFQISFWPCQNDKRTSWDA